MLIPKSCKHVYSTHGLTCQCNRDFLHKYSQWVIICNNLIVYIQADQTINEKICWRFDLADFLKAYCKPCFNWFKASGCFCQSKSLVWDFNVYLCVFIAIVKSYVYVGIVCEIGPIHKMTYKFNEWIK